jgi:hypothetical protein
VDFATGQQDSPTPAQTGDGAGRKGDRNFPRTDWLNLEDHAGFTQIFDTNTPTE